MLFRSDLVCWVSRPGVTRGAARSRLRRNGRRELAQAWKKENVWIYPGSIVWNNHATSRHTTKGEVQAKYVGGAVEKFRWHGPRSATLRSITCHKTAKRGGFDKTQSQIARACGKTRKPHVTGSREPRGGGMWVGMRIDRGTTEFHALPATQFLVRNGHRVVSE